MSENGEIYTAGKNFTLPLAVTAWTNSTSGDIMVAKTKGSLLCMYVWKCVYMDKHMLRASQVPGTPLSWVRPSSEKHPDGGEGGGEGVRTQCTWLSCIFTVTISHVQHASSSWLIARSIIILLQNMSLWQSIDSWKSSPADWGQILSTISPGHTMVPAYIACLAYKNSFW